MGISLLLKMGSDKLSYEGDSLKTSGGHWIYFMKYFGKYFIWKAYALLYYYDNPIF